MSGLEDAVLRNIQAVAELSDLVRTSFGPNGVFSTLKPCFSFCANARCGTTTGRNKLLVNHLGKLFVTSDAATIIREIEVVHPAAKLLVMASQAQEAEVCQPILLEAIAELTQPSGLVDGRRDEHGVNIRRRTPEKGRTSSGHGIASE